MILQVQQLTKVFGALKAVDGVDLTLEEGELSSIIGPNGAGKSTFFNLLTSHLMADSGKIIFRNEDITNLTPYKVCWRGLAKSFQITSIFPLLSVLENVQVALQVKRGKSLNFFRSAKGELRDEALEILETVGLLRHADETSALLAHGDQKLLELAITLASEPYMLLLDEPTAGMAAEETATTIELIQRLNKERGLTILFTEHDMSVVLSISQKIMVMNYGRVIARGTPEEVRDNEEVRRVYLGE